MLWHGLSCVFKGLVEGSPNFVERNGAVDLLPVDEESWRCTYTQFIRLFHGGTDGVFILRLQAGLQLGRVDVVLLPLLNRHLIEDIETRGLSFFIVNIAFVGMDLVGEIPISVGV